MPKVNFAEQHATYICGHTAEYDVRVGQGLFNWLPLAVSQRVQGQLFDPFHRVMNRQDVMDWMDEHLIFDDRGQIVALFDGDRFLWEKKIR